MAFLGAYSDVLKTYSGIFLLDLPKVELHAIFFLFFFAYNSTLWKSC